MYVCLNIEVELFYKVVNVCICVYAVHVVRVDSSAQLADLILLSTLLMEKETHPSKKLFLVN